MVITSIVGCQALWRTNLEASPMCPRPAVSKGGSKPPLWEQPDKYTAWSPEPEAEGPDPVWNKLCDLATVIGSLPSQCS